MNRRFWIGISLGLNVALAAVVVLAAHARGFDRRPTHGAAPFSNRVVRVRQVPDATNAVVIALNAPFHWAQLESTDYRVYVANLRAIGCPEATLRDIIEADVNEMFAGRVQRLVEAETGRFWELMLKRRELERLVEAKEEELRSMHEEKEEMLQALLDANGAGAKAKQAERQAETFANLKDQLDFLTDDKIALIQEAHERENAAGNALEKSEPALTPEEKRRTWEELAAEADQTIQAQLTPEEFAEYKLRTSYAGRILYELGDLEVTETEARALTAANMGPQREDRIQALLGPERYAGYKRAGDSGYLRTRQITDRFELPPETAVQVCEMQKAIQEQAKSIRNDAQRTGEERQAILRALRAEAEQSIRAALGPDVFKTYLKYNGTWLSGFADSVQ